MVFIWYQDILKSLTVKDILQKLIQQKTTSKKNVSKLIYSVVIISKLNFLTLSSRFATGFAYIS